MPNQWYTQIIYLWYLFNDLFNYFVVIVFLFWCFKGLRGCLYGSRYIVQGIYRLTDITFSMYLYERTKVISRFSWDFTWALFFHKQQDKKTMKYTKNVLHEGLKLKGLILFAANLPDGWCCMPPCFGEYSTCSSNAEVVYYNMLHSIRNPIECPFGWLKARWGFLTRTITLQLENVPAAIFSCFVLHNVCEMNQCGVDPDLVPKLAELH